MQEASGDCRACNILLYGTLVNLRDYCLLCNRICVIN